MKTILFFMSGYSWAEVRYRDAVFQCARAQDANATEPVVETRKRFAPCSNGSLMVMPWPHGSHRLAAGV